LRAEKPIEDELNTTAFLLDKHFSAEACFGQTIRPLRYSSPRESLMSEAEELNGTPDL